MSRPGFEKVLADFAAYRDAAKLPIEQATVRVSEKYARRKLGLKKDEPLALHGMTLKCIGARPREAE